MLRESGICACSLFEPNSKVLCNTVLAIGMFVTIFSEEMCSCVCVCYSLAKCCCKIKEDEEVRRRRWSRKVLYEGF